MKRSDVFPSNYLGKDDVRSPIRAVIQTVEMRAIKSDHGEEEKAVMLFTDNNIKPMIVNNTNWLTCEEKYGEESDNWRGCQVEIYFDTTIMFGGKKTGGVRLRIPSGATGGGYDKFAPPRNAPPAAPTLSQRHAQALAGFNGAPDLAALEKWATWAQNFPFGPVQKQQLDGAYHDAKFRLSPSNLDNDPPPPDVLNAPPPGVGADDIPF